MSEDTNIQIIGDATLFVCLFGWCFTSHSKNFHSFGDITMTGEGLQILTFARHSWPLSSEVFFQRATPTVTRDIHYNARLRGPETLFKSYSQEPLSEFQSNLQISSLNYCYCNVLIVALIGQMWFFLSELFFM